jgi:hypothetical protein
MKNLKNKLISFKYLDRKNPITGFLIDYNQDWTLIKYNPVDYIIDGYMILRSNLIKEYKRDDSEVFTEKVLLTKGYKPNRKDKIPLTDIGQTLKMISNKFGAFEIEKKDETVCFIGRFINITNYHVVIQEIDEKANWVELEKYRLSSIRIIQFDTDYNNTLILYNRTKKIKRHPTRSIK